jgi:hypothetical protein
MKIVEFTKHAKLAKHAPKLSWRDLMLLNRVLPEGDYSHITEAEMQEIRAKHQQEQAKPKTWQERLAAAVVDGIKEHGKGLSEFVVIFALSSTMVLSAYGFFIL